MRSNDAQPVLATDLLLREGAITFPARLETLSARNAPPLYEPGTRVKLTGICHIEQPPLGSSDPRGFELILRDAADIQVIRRPSWWTSERLLGALSAALLVTLGALLWIRMLRRPGARADTRIARGERGRRNGQQGQERISGQHEPRDSHATQRCDWHGEPGARGRYRPGDPCRSGDRSPFRGNTAGTS